MQEDFFLDNSFQTILDRDGQVIYYPQALSGLDFERLKSEITWEEHEITLYGKTHNVPRLSAFFADNPNSSYPYSGITMQAHPWSNYLKEIKSLAEIKVGNYYNCALVNLYRGGTDYAAWHSDDERELDPNSSILSLSIGESRRFSLMHKTDKGQEKVVIDLHDGDLVLMEPPLQKHWKHQLNKTAK